jgi:ribosome maturation factor RimP
MSTADTIRRLVAPVIEGLDLDLDDVVFTGGVLRITVDRVGGVDIEALSATSEAVSRVLDDEDPIPSRYTLEVSSPGLERPLRTPSHFQRYVGTKVNVKTLPHVEGDRRVEGVLEAADDHGITVAGRRLDYAEIERARTVFEWGGQPKPGSNSKRTKGNKAAREVQPTEGGR